MNCRRRCGPSKRVLIGVSVLVAARMASAATEGEGKPGDQVRLGVPVVEMAKLGATRGGSAGAEMVVHAVVDGNVSGNQAVNVTSGQNVINGGAFAGVSGVPTVIQNSGSNVLIQTSTVVNVTIK